MSDKVLVDSNVWIYAFMQGYDARIKTATKLIAETDTIILSTQIINEVCNILLRKHRVSNQTIANYIDYFYEEYTVSVLDELTLKLASDLRINHTLSFWDSFIVATAIQNSCVTLYSEDMQHNFVIRNTRILNPFNS